MGQELICMKKKEFVSFHLNFNLRYWYVLLIWFALAIVFFPSIARSQVPPAGQSGVVEKSLRKSQPRINIPAKGEIPNITIKDSRKLEDAGAGPSFFVSRIEIEGNTLIDDETLAPLVDIQEGLEMTLGVVSLYAQEVTAYYNSEGYILARAYIPEQEIKDGVIRLKVVEGRVGAVNIRGTERLKAKDFAQRLERVKDDQILREQTLEKVLLELNDMLGVQVRSVLKPGELPGTSDLVLEVTESRPYQVSFDADNFGSRFTGKNRFGLTGTVGSLFKLGDQFSVRVVESDENQTFVQPVYSIPVGSYGTTIKGSFTYSEFKLGDSVASLEAGGSAVLVDIGVNQLLLRNRTTRITANGGLEFRNFQNRQFAPVSDTTTSDDRLGDFYVGLGGNISDSYRGNTFFNIRTQFGFSEGSLNEPLNSRAQGRGNGTVATVDLSRYQGTNVLNSYFFLKAEGQVVSDRVLSPDQISIGGFGTVRGYPIAEFSGDNGYVFSLEYVLPVPSKSPVGIGKLTLDRVLSFVFFLDHARVFVLDKQPGENDQSISGAGGGIRINVPKSKPHDLSASFSLLYGTPVFGGPAPSDASSGIVYVNGIITY